MNRKKSVQRGFTLVELIVTISILTVLAGVLIPSVNNYLAKSNVGKANVEMKEIANAFSRYKADTFDWPTAWGAPPIKTGKGDFSAYECLYQNYNKRKGWAGPYLNKGIMNGKKMNAAMWTKSDGWGGLLDPWGRPYKVYSFADGYKGLSGAMMLVSTGYDGKLSSNTTDIFNAKPKKDDIIQTITLSVK